MNKFFIVVLCLFVAVSCFNIAPEVDPALEKCIKERCSDKYAKCKATKGCEDKLNTCEAKCGAKVNQTCWTFCIGLPGAAANVATCAANQKCLSSVPSPNIFTIIRKFLDVIENP
jgi:hypothetical protein